LIPSESTFIPPTDEQTTETKQCPEDCGQCRICVDGEHKLYVAINDSTGNIISKSRPVSFLVREAQAVSAEEFIAPIVESQPSFLQKWQWYLIGAGVVILLGLITFIFYFLKKRQNA